MANHSIWAFPASPKILDTFCDRRSHGAGAKYSSLYSDCFVSLDIKLNPLIFYVFLFLIRKAVEFYKHIHADADEAVEEESLCEDEGEEEDSD